MSNENEKGLVLVSGLGNSPVIGEIVAGMTSEERLSLERDILRSDLAIVYASLEIKQSQDIQNVPLNILDARFAIIPEMDKKTKEVVDKTVVNFLCENVETGEKFSVTKGANNFNNTYVEYFDNRRGVAYRPLMNYQFVEDRNYEQAGNYAIVLRMIQPAQSAATAASSTDKGEKS